MLTLEIVWWFSKFSSTWQVISIRIHKKCLELENLPDYIDLVFEFLGIKMIVYQSSLYSTIKKSSG